MESGTKTRITELEIKLSYTEDLVEELNQAVSHQQAQISLLQDQLRTVFQQMQQMAPGVRGEQGDAREDVPPHY